MLSTVNYWIDFEKQNYILYILTKFYLSWTIWHCQSMTPSVNFTNILRVFYDFCAKVKLASFLYFILLWHNKFGEKAMLDMMVKLTTKGIVNQYTYLVMKYNKFENCYEKLTKFIYLRIYWSRIATFCSHSKETVFQKKCFAYYSNDPEWYFIVVYKLYCNVHLD